MELVPQVYRMTKRFPPDELYGITSQIRRAIVSVPAKGSLAEVDTLMITSCKLGYLDETTMAKIEPQIIHIRQLLQKLMQSIVGPIEGGHSGGGRESSTPDARRPTPDGTLR